MLPGLNGGCTGLEYWHLTRLRVGNLFVVIIDGIGGINMSDIRKLIGEESNYYIHENMPELEAQHRMIAQLKAMDILVDTIDELRRVILSRNS
jgi:hypothetical protein